MRDLFRCLVLVAFAPFALLFVGPLLLLAAARGRQPVGSVIVRPARGGWSGRLVTGLVGIVLWVATWGGLTLLTWPTIEPTLIPQTTRVPEAPASSPPSPPPSQPDAARSAAPAMTEPTLAATVISAISPTVLSVAAVTETPGTAGWTPTPTVPRPSVEVLAATASPTPAPSPTVTRMPTLTVTPLPTATQAPPATPTPLPSATLRPTPVPTPTAMPTASATPSPSLTPSPTATATPSITPTEVGEQMALAISAVESANEMLRLAIETPTSEVLASLEQIWKERSLGKAQTFATGMYYRVGKPVKASYVYLVPPRVTHEPAQNLMLVDAIEVWTYEGSVLVYVEAFQFNYTLAQRDGRWVIVDYWYRNAPTAEPPHTY